MYYFENGFEYSRGVSKKFADALWIIFFCNQEDAYMYYMESGFKYSGGTSVDFLDFLSVIMRMLTCIVRRVDPSILEEFP